MTATGRSRPYGVRLAIPDLPVVGKDDQPGVELLLQLGKFFTGQDSPDDGWVTVAGGQALPAGVSMFLLDETDDVPSVQPACRGGQRRRRRQEGRRPTVDRRRRLRPRRHRSARVRRQARRRSNRRRWRCTIRRPRHPARARLRQGVGRQPGGGQPAVVGRGSGGDDGTGGGARNAVNPDVSLSGVYLRGGSELVRRRVDDADDVPTKQVTLPVQRADGPLHVDKIGLGWDGDTQRFELSLTADVVAPPRDRHSVDPSLGIPVTHPAGLRRVPASV